MEIDRLKNAVENLLIDKNNSYILSYPEFIKFFAEIGEINKHDLIISSHFVYGWMPTIINFNSENLDKVLELLNLAKEGILLNEKQLEIIKKSINNSMVGTSKLLHFINPRKYAIWDSRVFKFLTGRNTSYGIEKPKMYLEYLEKLKEISKHPEYQDLHIEVEKKFNYEITPFRAIEIIMFESDRQKKNTIN
jgi:hypothetical protein